MKQHANKLPILFSILLHAVIFTLLFVHISSKKITPASEAHIIKAIAINEHQLQAASMMPEKNKFTPVQPLNQDKIRRIEQIALKQPEAGKLPAEVPAPSKAPPTPTPVVKKESVPEKEVALASPRLAEKLHPQDLKQQEEKKKNEQKQKEALLKKRRSEEFKRLQTEIALEAQQAEKTETPSLADETLDSELHAEKSQLNEAKTNESSKSSDTVSPVVGEIDKYKQLIIQTIGRKWLMPETDSKDLACQLLVHVGPGGIVLNIEVLKASGDDNLDRSARNAILKASPLPVPADSELFDNFRSLRLTFRPQGIISG